MTKFVSRHSGQVQKMIEEAYQQGRADTIENVKKYIRLKTHYHYAEKEKDFLLAHEMYEWLEEQLKEQNK